MFKNPSDGNGKSSEQSSLGMTPESRERHKMYRKDTVYALSLTPLKQHQNVLVSRDRHIIQDVLKYLDPIKLYADYNLFPEIAKSKNNHGVFHYHGILTITDPYGFHLYGLNHLCNGFTYEIDTIQNNNDWELYYTKDKELMLPSLKKSKLPYRINHLTPNTLESWSIQRQTKSNLKKLNKK